MSKITKKRLHQIIDNMPEDFSLEDLQYELFILQKLEKAEEQLEQGCETYTLDEMRKMANQWHDKKTQTN